MYNFDSAQSDTQKQELELRYLNLKSETDHCIMRNSKTPYNPNKTSLQNKKSEDLKKRLHSYANEVFKAYNRVKSGFDGLNEDSCLSFSIKFDLI